MSFDWRAFRNAWGGDHFADAVAGFLAEDAVYEDRATRGRYEGRTAVAAFFESPAPEGWTTLSSDIVDLIETEDRFAAEYVWRVTPRVLAGGPEAQSPVEVLGVWVGRLESGQITEIHDYWDQTLLEGPLEGDRALAGTAAR